MNRFATATCLLTVLCSITGRETLCYSDELRFVREGLALRGLDPVVLTQGQEVAGDPNIVEVFGRYRYAFQNEENRRLFAADKERYAVQFGGACMRMGPLSGGGDSDRFHVHDGRIYLFASDSCLNTFLKDPERFIEPIDEVPVGSDDDERAAEALLRRAVEAIGGEERLRNIHSIESVQQLTQKSDNTTTQLTRTLLTQFPLTHVRMDDYGDYRSGWTLRGDAGYFSWEKGAKVDESVRQVMIRELCRLPVVILKSWIDGDVIAVRTGDATAGDLKVEIVSAFVHGAATSLHIRPDNGQIVGIEYRGRTNQGISTIRRDFSDFRDVEGLSVPFAVKSFINGTEQTATEVVLKEMKINRPVDARLIAIPEPR